MGVKSAAVLIYRDRGRNVLILVFDLRKTGSLYLDDVLSQSAEFILRNLVQHVLTFQNTPGFKIQPKKISSPSQLKYTR